MKRVRQLLGILLVMAMIIVMLPSHAHALPETGCSRSPTGLHSWVKSGRARDPNCTQGGSYRYQCSYCFQYETGPDGEIPPLGHSWDSGTTTKQATCTEKGVITHTCTRCGETKQEETAALGHRWDNGTVTKQATCTEKGSRTFKCTRCGTTRKEDIPKLNHDWEKKTIQPSGMTDGQIVTTCRRCGETETEVIPAAPAFFAALRNGGNDESSDSDMKIVQNPKGGVIDRDGGDQLTLTVVVEGGVEPYTYTWNYDPLEPEETDTSPIVNASTLGLLDGMEYTYQGAAKEWYEANAEAFENVFAPEWLETVLGEGDGGLGALLENVGSGNPKTGQSDGPEIVATKSGDYWVEVRDNENHILISDAARVYYRIRIGEQPRDVNLQTDADENGRVRLDCKAVDGSGVYKYEWFQYGSAEPCGTGSFYEADEKGDYFCRVTDEWTGDAVDSDTVEVYEADPLRWYDITADAMLWPEEEWELNVTIEGGVPPYEVWWDRDEVPLYTQQGPDDAGGRATFFADGGVGAGKFTLHVTDTKGVSLTAVTMRRDRELTITSQPQDDVFLKNKSADISVTVSDGDAPYTFILYKYPNDEQIASETKNKTSATFKIWTPGIYYILIRDANGHEVQSNSALFYEQAFHFTDYSLQAQITGDKNYARLYAYVESGVEPYHYEWLEKTNNGWRKYELGQQMAFLAWKPGIYACRVRDDEGTTIRTLDMTVTYTGDAPLIIKQPQDQLQPREDEKFTLSCRAVSGTGNDGNLRYEWYWMDTYTLDGWYFDASGPDLQEHRQGLYKCVVTDTVTGKSVQSELAAVQQQLNIISAEIFAHDYPAKGWGTYHLHFEGGTGPYTVEVYLKGREDKGAKDILVDSNTVIGTYPRFYEPLWETAMYGTGLGAREQVPASYYFVVTDSYGQTATSDLVVP